MFPTARSLRAANQSAPASISHRQSPGAQGSTPRKVSYIASVSSEKHPTPSRRTTKLPRNKPFAGATFFAVLYENFRHLSTTSPSSYAVTSLGGTRMGALRRSQPARAGRSYVANVAVWARPRRLRPAPTKPGARRHRSLRRRRRSKRRGGRSRPSPEENSPRRRPTVTIAAPAEGRVRAVRRAPREKLLRGCVIPRKSSWDWDWDGASLSRKELRKTFVPRSGVPTEHDCK
jgi:hypothetical protein